MPRRSVSEDVLNCLLVSLMRRVSPYPDPVRSLVKAPRAVAVLADIICTRHDYYHVVLFDLLLVPFSNLLTWKPQQRPQPRPRGSSGTRSSIHSTPSPLTSASQPSNPQSATSARSSLALHSTYPSQSPAVQCGLRGLWVVVARFRARRCRLGGLLAGGEERFGAVCCARAG